MVDFKPSFEPIEQIWQQTADFVCQQYTEVCETDTRRRAALLELVRLIKTQSSAGTTAAETQRHTQSAGRILMTQSSLYSTDPGSDPA